MGTLWSIQEPLRSDYANCEARSLFDNAGVCSVCFGPRPRCVAPFSVEWCFGSDVIGDFSWPGFYGEALVSERVASTLSAEVGGVEFEEVLFVETGGYDEGRSARRLPRVGLPLTEAHLTRLQMQTYIPLHTRYSSVTTYDCSSCERILLRVSDQSDWDIVWVGEDPEPERRLRQRRRGSGIIIEEGNLGDCRLFAVEDLPLSLYCTDEVRQLARREGWTNVQFLEAGETVPSAP